jgi:catechol 2,3-dioxygenase-like lactoylglutathione lyase family enzyme
MKLGAFSVSLAVKDIQSSLRFYETLGFSIFHGDVEQGWLILKNEDTKIGLFQGMFDKNMLTFNPGWSSDAEALSDFKDVRDIQSSVKAAGYDLTTEVDVETSGPASFVVIDPDGNPVLIDQHI